MKSLRGISLNDLIPHDLPSGPDLVAQGRRIGASIATTPSVFLANRGFNNELEYKLEMARQGRTMTALTIGLQDWSDTKAGLEHIVSVAQERGFYIDRYILALDRRMGLPESMRGDAIKETGPMLVGDEWLEIGQTIDIQPHMGDMMIGSPASIENTCNALRAGTNYIGNMSQFAWKYQGWPGSDADQMGEVVKALGVMASKKHVGAVVHSYLDDGFPAQFSDYTSYIGWAKFERYVVETLVGAHLGHAYGGLSYSPSTKTAVTIAMESLRPNDVCSSFYYTNTTRYSSDITRNYGLLATDALQLMLVDRYLRAGAAIMPVPATEAIRVPTPNEILDVQTIARDVAERLDDIYPLVDWSGPQSASEELALYGATFFDNLMNGLSDLGIDLADPLQLLLAVRRLGARRIEQEFGVGVPTEDPAADGYQPLIPTDTVRDFLAAREEVRSRVRPHDWNLSRPHELVVGSSDVHEMGLRLVADAVEQLGIKPIVAGVGVDPIELALLAFQRQATALLVSTHNGMALAYAERLMQELNAYGIAPQVIFGGRLNQDLPDSDMPVDVTEQLIALGIDVCNDPAQLAQVIKQ